MNLAFQLYGLHGSMRPVRIKRLELNKLGPFVDASIDFPEPTGDGELVLFEGPNASRCSPGDREARRRGCHRLRVRCARHRHEGQATEVQIVFDITRGTGGERSAPFAPSWGILRPALAGLRQGGDAAERAWSIYMVAFEAEMAASERQHPEAWEYVTTWLPRVLLACHCPKQSGDDAIPLRCHRVLVARRLERRGARYMGEIGRAMVRARRTA